MVKITIAKEKNMAKVRKYNMLLSQLKDAVESKNKNKTEEIFNSVQQFGGIFGFSEVEERAITFLNSK